MRKLVIDFETRSPALLKKCGTWLYATHPQTEVLCVAFAFAGEGGKPVVLETDRVASLDCELRKYAQDENTMFVAHSAFFEYLIWNYILVPRYGYPPLWEPRRWGCTLSRAAMCGLPQSLEKAGAALGLKTRKDLFGKSAMLKFSKARLPTEAEIALLGDAADAAPVYLEKEDAPELYQKMLSYCADDVASEIELDSRLPELPPAERRVWEMDLLINCRGLKLDMDAAARARDMAKELSGDLNARLNSITGGAVSAASQVGEMKRYLVSQGVEVDSLDRYAVTMLLADSATPPKVREVLNIRRQVGKSSTAKYAKILEMTDTRDGRARGLLQYHGAATGRFAGRGLQIHNLPKGVKESTQKEIIDDILTGDSALFSAIYGDGAMGALSSALRGMITADRGKKLVIADFAAIEARVVLWLAGDEEAMRMFREGVNLYEDMGRFLFKRADINKSKTPQEYGIAKAAVLGCGYGLGAARFVGNCAQNGLVISEEMALKAVRAYRAKYKSVVAMWYSLERAAVNAIRTPSAVYPSCGGRILWGMDRKREFLCAKLPANRHLRFYRPSLVTVDSPRGEKEEIRYFTTGLGGGLELTKTYGGSLAENVTQAVARDILVHGMFNCENAGYPVVASVHDEIISEVPDIELKSGGKSLEEFIRLMCSLPPWAGGLPVAAEGFVAQRYRK